MYKTFNIETDKDLIVLNYYIEQNAKHSIIELTIKDVENILSVNRSKAYRCIKKLEELQIIKAIEKANSKAKKTEYKYLLDKNMNNDVKSVSQAIPEHLNLYAEIYIKQLGHATEGKIIDILSIEGIENIDIKLFEDILKDSKINAIKNPHNYAKRSILQSIEDKVFTATERKEHQSKFYSFKEVSHNNTAKNYTDNSDQEDWEALTQQSAIYP